MDSLTAATLYDTIMRSLGSGPPSDIIEEVVYVFEPEVELIVNGETIISGHSAAPPPAFYPAYNKARELLNTGGTMTELRQFLVAQSTVGDTA